MHVESSNGVQVAVHEFGGSGRPLLLSHATGFHAHCYQPIAERLSDSFTSYGHDHRGHGETPRPDDWQVDWNCFGDDALAAAESITSRGDGASDGDIGGAVGLVGFGHSMGGASLVMAAHRNPGLFDVIVAFEPIIFPQLMGQPGDDPSPMVAAARNRRATFDSYDAAFENYASKPPMQFFDPEVLRLYVDYGFAPTNESGDDVGGVTLRCAPEHEARTFETGATHNLFDLLAEIETRIIVVSGKVEVERSPAGIAERVADRLPNGTFIELEAGNHLSPFIDPEEFARLILDAV